jgi:hypothetical protein
MKRIPTLRTLSVFASGVGLLASACGDDTLQPTPIAHVSLALRVEPVIGPLGAGYNITATVTNDGDVTVRWVDVSCRGLTEVRGPDGQVVQLHLPMACPMGTPFPAELGPGAVRTESVPFNGILYDLDGRQVDAPPGAYAAEASFTWFAPGEVEAHQETLRQTFDWPAR